MSILILGGTGRIGPHFVRAAIARGHRVAVFSRGKKDDDELPATVERLTGDRNGDLESIRGRDWDAVLDLATFTPDWVRSVGEALRDRINHYLFISTVSVYDHPELNDRTRETSQVLENGSTQPEKYGANKVQSEREAQRQFPGRTAVLRPGYLVGPGDRAGYLTFWLLRMQKGGDVIAPGDPMLPFQCIDVRDLAELSIRLAEKRTTGIFNAVGPAAQTSLGQMIEAARTTVASAATVTWIPAAIIAAQRDQSLWRKPLFWSWYSEAAGQANIMRMSNERALTHGLALRPLGVTMADTMNWYQQQPATVQATLAPGYEQPKGDGEAASAETLWRRYLQREHEVLAAWLGKPADTGCRGAVVSIRAW